MNTPLDYLPPPPALRFSAAGAVSLALGVLTPFIYFLMLFTRQTPGAGGPPPWVGLVLVAGMLGCPAAGLALGLVALRTPGRRRGFAIAGVVVNALCLLPPLAILTLYLAFRR